MELEDIPDKRFVREHFILSGVECKNLSSVIQVSSRESRVTALPVDTDRRDHSDLVENLARTA